MSRAFYTHAHAPLSPNANAAEVLVASASGFGAVGGVPQTGRGTRTDANNTPGSTVQRRVAVRTSPGAERRACVRARLLFPKLLKNVITLAPDKVVRTAFAATMFSHGKNPCVFANNSGGRMLLNAAYTTASGACGVGGTPVSDCINMICVCVCASGSKACRISMCRCRGSAVITSA